MNNRKVLKSRFISLKWLSFALIWPNWIISRLETYFLSKYWTCILGKRMPRRKKKIKEASESQNLEKKDLETSSCVSIKKKRRLEDLLIVISDSDGEVSIWHGIVSLKLGLFTHTHKALFWLYLPTSLLNSFGSYLIFFWFLKGIVDYLKARVVILFGWGWMISFWFCNMLTQCDFRTVRVKSKESVICVWKVRENVTASWDGFQASYMRGTMLPAWPRT